MSFSTLEGVKPLPCVGCGWCCRKVWCYASLKEHGFEKLNGIYGKGGYCPELRWNGKKWRCRLVKRNVRYRVMLDIGEGCCASLNTERRAIPEPSMVTAQATERAAAWVH